MSTKLRPKVPCDCKKCNGKLVDTRTRKKHYEEEKQFQSSMKKGKEKEASSSIHASTSGNRSRSDLVDSFLLSKKRSNERFFLISVATAFENGHFGRSFFSGSL